MRTRNGSRGSTLVEFALALTLFLMTSLGTVEFALLVFRYNMLSNLAQEGARRAAVCGKTRGLGADACNIPTFVRSRSVGIDLSAVTTTPSDLTTLNRGDTVTVRVAHVFNPLTRIVPITTLTLSSTAQMNVQR